MYGSSGGLRGRKSDLFDGGIRVPCIIRYPGAVVPGSVSEVPVHGYDLLPTVASMLGVSLPNDRPIDGIDFSPIFSGQEIKRDKPLFWAFDTREFDDPAGYYFAVRDGDWKLIADKEIKKALLYNLKEDPHEVRELSSLHPEEAERLKQAIREIYKSIQEDPLRPD